MTREQTIQLIIDSIALVAPPETIPPSIDDNTRVLGRNAFLDSMALVSLLVEIEQQINDRVGASITIASEQAMSMQRSPFRSVGTLADYIQILLAQAGIN